MSYTVCMRLAIGSTYSVIEIILIYLSNKVVHSYAKVYNKHMDEQNIGRPAGKPSVDTSPFINNL